MTTMTAQDLKSWQHAHNFATATATERQARRHTRRAASLAFAAMLVELAIGWRMASHAGLES